jgi:AcrR family transcriptional regulator
MRRRSDHTGPEIETTIVDAGATLMAEYGFTRFSARKVAKRVGHSIGTIYEVCGRAGALVLAIDTSTFEPWADHLRAELAAGGDDRIRSLVDGYFAFARENTDLWIAISTIVCRPAWRWPRMTLSPESC